MLTVLVLLLLLAIAYILFVIRNEQKKSPRTSYNRARPNEREDDYWDMIDYIEHDIDDFFGPPWQ